MQNNLLESRDARNRIRYPIAALDPTILIWVPEIDLQHVVALTPYSVSEVETIEYLERAALQAVSLAVEDLAIYKPMLHEGCGMLRTLVPLLSIILVLTPSLLIQLAVIRPAGPAPTMSTSTCVLSVEAVSFVIVILLYARVANANEQWFGLRAKEKGIHEMTC